MRDTSSTKVRDELKIPQNDTGTTNNSLCTSFCPSTCKCFGRSMQCVDRDCSVLTRVITLHNVNCDVIDVVGFDSRYIFRLNISSSVIGNLSVSPKNNRIMFHNIRIEDTTVDTILIERPSSKLKYLHSIQLKNCTIGTSINGYDVHGFKLFHIYRKSAFAFHIKSLIMNLSTEIVTASVNFPDDIYLEVGFNDMVNFSNCGLTDKAQISPFTSQIVDVSHNFLKQYMYRPMAVTALYIQHNLLSSMIVSDNLSLNQYDNLEVLDISYNRISELKDGDLFFAKLFYLNLRGNQIRAIDADVFLETTKLVFLDLSRNKISRIITGIFQPLEFLQELYIQENEFQVSDGMFDGLKRLKLMQVEFFSICCSKPKSLNQLRCIAPGNEISSCDNLIDVSLLSVTIWYIAFMATFGNFVVLTYNVHYLKNMPPDKYTVFIVNLSLADFLMGIYLNILAIINQMYTGRYGLADYAWRHSVTCTVSGIIATLSSEASALMVFLITLDRFIAVKYPFSKLLFSVKTASILSLVAWVFSLVLSLIPLLPVPDFKDFYARSGICISLPLSAVRKSGWEYSMIIFVGFNFFLFLGILVGQISIFAEVLRSGRSVRSSKSMQREKALAVTVFGVVLTDILCWIPVGTIGMLTFFGMAVPPDVYAWIIVVVLPINSALNPLLYTLTAIIGRMRRRESDVVSQLKHQLAYWKSKNGCPSDVTVFEIQEGNATQKSS
ncbi:G-protein coupled receptor GRL101-like [Ostrea edulis]|uniref:G-protein coupled receptor GRL101-like n=1 Tax=Ostrea edulis TaxID=37623 RepID=UPI0024AFAC54|nr:G-protein coupled receptor GRL101-like [Ostrea edulis]